MSRERARELERRIERALAKYDRGEALTAKEEEIVYWARHGGGCSSCAVGMPVVVRSGGPDGISKVGGCEGESRPKTESVGVRRRERGRSVVS